MLCSLLMTSGVPPSLAVGYSEYFPVSSLKPHRRLIVIKIVAKISSKLNCSLIQNLQNSQVMTCVRKLTWPIIPLVTSALSVVRKDYITRSLVMKTRRFVSIGRSIRPRKSQTNLVCDTARLGTWTQTVCTKIY